MQTTGRTDLDVITLPGTFAHNQTNVDLVGFTDSTRDANEPTVFDGNLVLGSDTNDNANIDAPLLEIGADDHGYNYDFPNFFYEVDHILDIQKDQQELAPLIVSDLVFAVDNVSLTQPGCMSNGPVQKSFENEQLQQPIGIGQPQQPIGNGQQQQPMANGQQQQPMANGQQQQAMTNGQLQQPMANGQLQQPMANGQLQQPIGNSPAQRRRRNGPGPKPISIKPVYKIHARKRHRLTPAQREAEKKRSRENREKKKSEIEMLKLENQELKEKLETVQKRNQELEAALEKFRRSSPECLQVDSRDTVKKSLKFKTLSIF